LATIIDEMAAEAAQEHTEAIRRYLAERLPMHDADKDDLLPLLRERCQPVDGAEEVLDRLHTERGRDAQLIGGVKSNLVALASGRPIIRLLDFVFHALAFIEAHER